MNLTSTFDKILEKRRNYLTSWKKMYCALRNSERHLFKTIEEHIYSEQRETFSQLLDNEDLCLPSGTDLCLPINWDIQTVLYDCNDYYFYSSAHVFKYEALKHLSVKVLHGELKKLEDSLYKCLPNVELPKQKEEQLGYVILEELRCYLKFDVDENMLHLMDKVLEKNKITKLQTDLLKLIELNQYLAPFSVAITATKTQESVLVKPYYHRPLWHKKVPKEEEFERLF